MASSWHHPESRMGALRSSRAGATYPAVQAATQLPTTSVIDPAPHDSDFPLNVPYISTFQRPHTGAILGARTDVSTSSHDFTVYTLRYKKRSKKRLCWFKTLATSHSVLDGCSPRHSPC